MYTCERCTFKIDEIDIFTDTLSFFTREYSPKREDRGGRFIGEFFGFFFHNTRIELTSFEPKGIYGHRAILENMRQKYLGTYYGNNFNT